VRLFQGAGRPVRAALHQCADGHATYTYDALFPAEQAALPPAEAITAAFAGAGELTVTARAEGTGVVEDGPDGLRP